jgi:hypothetical protein
MATTHQPPSFDADDADDADDRAEPASVVLPSSAARSLSRIVALLVAVACVAGLAAPRLYRDAPLIRDGWIANDAVTLFLALPVLVVASRRAAAGSLRAYLVWIGALHYVLYDYCFYVFGASLNALLLVYVAIVALASWSLVLGIAELDPRAVAATLRDPPARRVAAWMLFMAVGLGGTWIAQWLVALLRTEPAQRFDLTPEFVRVVAGIDLTLMVSVLVPGAAWLWRRRPWGLVVAGALTVSGALYNVVLAAGTLVQIRAGLAGAWWLLALWSVLCAGCVVSAAALLRRRQAQGT